MTPDVLVALTSTLVSSEALAAMRRALRDRGLISVEANLGGPAKSLPQQIMRIPERDLQETVALGVVQSGKVGLAVMYRDTAKKVNRIFALCMASAGVCLGVILFGMIAVFSKGLQMKSVESLAAIVPGLLSGGVFWLYTQERSNLTRVEGDISRLERFEAQVEIAASIQNEDQRNAAYSAIIKATVG